jgi:Flp pilus assembly protein TadG
MHALARAGRPRSRQRGTSAIEFVLIFPVFFLIFYAIVTYGVIFAAQQTLILAAQEAARSALQFQAGGLAARQTVALNVAQQILNQGPGAISKIVPLIQTQDPCSYNPSMTCIQVTLSYDYAAHPIIPSLPLLNFAVPATLTGSAIVQLNPENLIS